MSATDIARSVTQVCSKKMKPFENSLRHIIFEGDIFTVINHLNIEKTNLDIKTISHMIYLWNNYSEEIEFRHQKGLEIDMQIFYLSLLHKLTRESQRLKEIEPEFWWGWQCPHYGHQDMICDRTASKDLSQQHLSVTKVSLVEYESWFCERKSVSNLGWVGPEWAKLIRFKTRTRTNRFHSIGPV
ncbi:hypothetical protein YC2023_023208 [Brassica napus]